MKQITNTTDMNQVSKVSTKRSPEFIAGMVKSCRLARAVLEYITPYVVPGVSTLELNRLAHEFMIEHDARPATLNYCGYPSSICTSINEVICHGIPSERQLKDGDILNIDVTCDLFGYFGDNSRMFLVGNVSDEAKRLVAVTEKCLQLGIEATKPYGFIGDIGHAIATYARSCGFSVVEKFVGHGIGTSFHADPQIPHFGTPGSGEMIVPGMVFTIEPMINQGGKDLKILSDGWTAITLDGLLSAQFEHTIMVTDTAVRVLTAETDDMAVF